MRRLLWFAPALFVLVAAAAAPAQTPVLRLIPDEAHFVVVAPRPAAIARILEEHPVAKEIRGLELIQALYDNSKYRRLDQLIAYFEKKLDRPRGKIFEDLTTGGVALGVRIGDKPAVIAALQASDEKFLASVVQESLELINQELERQEIKERIGKASHGKTETHRFAGFHLAQVGRFLLFSNEEAFLNKAIDLARDDAATTKGSILSRLPARERGKDVLLWGWLDFETVQKDKKFADGFKAATTDPFLQLLAGGFLNVLKRTPSIEFELLAEGKDFRFRIDMPRGVKGMSDLAKSFVATDEKPLLPPLNPPRVLSSTTWTFDVGTLWKNKKAWLGDEAEKQFAMAETAVKPFLGGQTLSELLEGAGWNQRIVLAEEGKSPYKITPALHITPFGVVFDMRDERFGKTMNKLLRAGALVASFKFGLKMREETHNGQPIVCYYFDETKKVAEDANNLRFNFSPSFAIVGKSLIAASTAELARDLVDCVTKEDKALAAGVSWRTDLHAAGLAANLEFVRKDLLTATILDQGLPPAEAKKQLESLTELVRSLGTLQWQIRYGADDYRMDFHWKYKK
ncbi:MAG: hypothetical protein U0793_04740 [Gemmataceae bacterium]